MRDSFAILPLVLSFGLAGAAHAQDASAWAGLYGGVQLSYGEGSQDYNTLAGVYDIKGEAQGLFAGYLWTSGAWAYGAEIGYSSSNYHEFSLASAGGDEYPSYKFNHTLDLKARAGYAMNATLLWHARLWLLRISRWRRRARQPLRRQRCSGRLRGRADGH